MSRVCRVICVIIDHAVAGEMSENRKIAAILAADVAGFSRLAAADEDRTLARLRALRSDLIDPTIAVHKGHVVKRTGDFSSSNFAAWSTRFAAPSK
jgi:class 3 adenylate cyclase